MFHKDTPPPGLCSPSLDASSFEIPREFQNMGDDGGSGAYLLSLINPVESLDLNETENAADAFASGPATLVDPYAGIMTSRDCLHIQRIQLTPIIAVLKKVDASEDLLVSKSGVIEYPDDYFGDDFYYAKYMSRTETKTPQPTVSIDISRHIRHIVPHLPKSADRRTKISVEGALGTISLNSLRKPKQAIQAAMASTRNPDVEGYLSSLALAEKIAVALLNTDIDPTGRASLDGFMQDKNEWLLLSSTYKGRKLIPRLFHSLRVDHEHQLAFYSHLLSNMKSLLMYSDGLFVDLLLGPFLRLLPASSLESFLSISRSIAFQAKIAELLDRKEVFMTLCVVFNHAQLNIGSLHDQWRGVCEELFLALSGSFSLLFARDYPEADLFYAWQFLALLASNTGLDNCRLLLAELRLVIMQRIYESEESVQNVNRLLHVVGLDASQLMQH